jgi:glutaredoxin
MAIEHVAGRKAGDIMLYALSTCGWCRKTRELLEQLGVAYDYEYVDQLQGEEREKAVAAVRKWNPAGNFPTVVLDNQRCIIGFQEEALKEALKK